MVGCLTSCSRCQYGGFMVVEDGGDKPFASGSNVPDWPVSCTRQREVHGLACILFKLTRGGN